MKKHSRYASYLKVLRCRLLWIAILAPLGDAWGMPVNTMVLVGADSESAAVSAGARPEKRPADACDRLAASPDDRERLADGVKDVFLNGEGQAALTACREASRNRPGDRVVMFQLGRAYQAVAQYQEALDVYRKASETGHIEASFNLGLLLLRDGYSEGDDKKIS